METINNSLKGSALIKRDLIKIELSFDLNKFTNLQKIFSDSKDTRKKFLSAGFTLPQGSDVRVVELEGGQAAEADGEDGQVVGGAHAGANVIKLLVFITQSYSKMLD